MNKPTLLFLIGIFNLSLGLAQSTYDIKWERNEQFSETHGLCLDAGISFDVAGNLGSSKLVFAFDPTALNIPILIVDDYLKTAYGPVGLSLIGESTYSVNFDLKKSGEGIAIGEDDLFTKLATVCWQIKDTSKVAAVNWVKQGNFGTNIYLDDEQTRLSLNNKEDFKGINPPSPDIDETTQPLSIEFVDFTAFMKQDSSVELDWITRNEYHSEEYIVQRSTNGSMFQGIQMVIPKGNDSTTQHYHWVDQEAKLAYTGNSLFYRIIHVNSDDDFYHGEVKEVSWQAVEIDTFSLLSFQSQVVEKNVSLTWSAEHEEEISSYVIERSLDSINFEKVGEEVPTEGASVLKDYSFVDTTPFDALQEEVLYYRVLAMKGTEEVHMTQTQKVYMELVAPLITDMKIYPSPIIAGEVLTVEFPDPLTSAVQLRVVDAQGRTTLLDGLSLSEVEGATSLSLIVPVSFSGGNYHLLMSDQEQHYAGMTFQVNP